MRASLIAITVAALLLILPMQPSWGSTSNQKQSSISTDLQLPAALTDDDSFDELPFEQLRQALREEVEYGPKKGRSPRSSKRYNLLIR